MSKTAISIFCIGIYLILKGIIMVSVPNVLLAIFGIAATSEVWVRIVGMLVLILGYYYIRSARDEEGMTKFFRWTVPARSSIIVFFIIFVLLGFVKPILILFGAIELAGAIWTGVTLRSSAS